MFPTGEGASAQTHGSREPESAGPARVEEIYSWAGHLASESREFEWILDWYVWPNPVREIIRRLKGMNGGIIGLVGLQGVGKSSALLAILVGRMLLQKQEYREKQKSGPAPDFGRDMIRFKWRRQSELLPSLLNMTHEVSSEFYLEYCRGLVAELKARVPHLISKDFEETPQRLNPDWAARILGKSRMRALQQSSWLSLLRKKKLILIDTPDYSKTDRRLMAKDLDEIYWLWNSLSGRIKVEGVRPNFVIAIQKEMFRDHFFFDKMERVELEPLKPDEMVGAFRKRFKVTDPFTEDALLTLGRMSRGIFRRFLRYITLTLEYWERRGNGSIDTRIVKEAIPLRRLAEDMELELGELFPKQSQLKVLADNVFAREGPAKAEPTGPGTRFGTVCNEQTAAKARVEQTRNTNQKWNRQSCVPPNFTGSGRSVEHSTLSLEQNLGRGGGGAARLSPLDLQYCNNPSSTLPRTLRSNFER